ncbi:MAG TPA: dienelactone hydrolase family protein [Candidatus Dormibacteraeota bacterium]|nr:dienelactone hydrolase family protein [Candidatus Dormibacteraeota bacterium]
MASDGMRAGSVSITGAGGDEIEAYLAEPDGEGGPYGGVVVIHHLPGYDEGSREIARRFADHRYLAVCPNLFSRESARVGAAEAAGAARAAGGVPDDRLVGDVDGAVRFLRSRPGSNGRVGVIGYCSGGRQAFLSACRLTLDAAVDCYGAFVVNPPPAEYGLAARPIVDLAPTLSCPLLGLFGAEDTHPAPAEVAALSDALDAAGKAHEFHSLEGAGHAFFATDRPMYRPAAAVEGWRIVWDFLGRHLDAR